MRSRKSNQAVAQKKPPVERGSITMNNEGSDSRQVMSFASRSNGEPNVQDAETCLRTGIAIMFLKFSSLATARS